MKYEIYSRIDENGLAVESHVGFMKGETNDLREAEKMADIQGGYIRREDIDVQVG